MKTLLIGLIFLIAVSCEKAEVYDYDLYTGSWLAIDNAITYEISIQDVNPLLINYNVDGQEWNCTDLYKDFGRLYGSYSNQTPDGTEYCDIELVCLKYNKMACLIMFVSSTIPTDLYETNLIFTKQ